MKTNIKKAKYEGYVWRSNEAKPTVFYGDTEVELMLEDNENPFVIEGNLWDKATHTSVFIRYVDGHYIVKNTNVSNNDKASDKCTLKTYIAHRIKNVKSLIFLQYWKTVEDALCEGMYTLQPDKLVFIGFNKKED